MQGEWRVGTIGFAYDEWRARFYPARLRPSDRLAYYATQFPLVELDTTFYALPPKDRVRHWRESVPEGFRFILKAPREVTHGDWAEWKTGVAPGEILDRFLDLAAELGPKLACVLFQFPPSLRWAARNELAAILDRAQGRAPLAVEVRHESWFKEGAEAPLRAFGATCVAADLAPLGDAAHPPGITGYVPFPVRDTGAFVYLRLCGVHAQFESDGFEAFDATPRIDWWLAQLAPVLRPGRTVYATIGNSFAGHAPATTRRLMRRLGLEEPGGPQMSLFDE